MSTPIKKILRIAIISLISLIIVSGIGVLYLVLSFKQPDILATDSIITITNDGKLVGNTTLNIRNNNPYTIRIDSLSYTMAINGKTYLEGRKDSRIVLKAHGNSGFTLPYVVNSKDMDKDFKSRDSAVNHFIIDAYISVFAIKKMHIHIPFDKTIAFFKEPALIGDHNYIRVENNGNAKANLVVKLVNPNKYAIQLDSFTYSLVIESKKYLGGEKYKKIALGPLDTQNINIPLVFKMGKFVKNFKGRDSAVFEFRFELLL